MPQLAEDELDPREFFQASLSGPFLPDKAILE
jgi:hypothetical protein